MTPSLPDKEYFKIGEVAALVGVKPYVLRYWESEFKRDIRPERTRSNQRMYRKRDVETFLEIKRLRYEEKLELPGARKRLRGAGGKGGGKAEVAGDGVGESKMEAQVESPMESPMDSIDRELTDRQRTDSPEPLESIPSIEVPRAMRRVSVTELTAGDEESAAAVVAMRKIRRSLGELLRIVDEDEKRG